MENIIEWVFCIAVGAIIGVLLINPFEKDYKQFTDDIKPGDNVRCKLHKFDMVVKEIKGTKAECSFFVENRLYRLICDLDCLFPTNIKPIRRL